MKCLFKVVGSFLLLPVFIIGIVLSMFLTFVQVPLMLSGCFPNMKPAFFFYLEDIVEKWMDL